MLVLLVLRHDIKVKGCKHWHFLWYALLGSSFLYSTPHPVYSSANFSLTSLCSKSSIINDHNRQQHYWKCLSNSHNHSMAGPLLLNAGSDFLPFYLSLKLGQLDICPCSRASYPCPSWFFPVLQFPVLHKEWQPLLPSFSTLEMKKKIHFMHYCLFPTLDTSRGYLRIFEYWINLFRARNTEHFERDINCERRFLASLHLKSFVSVPSKG